jgi:hypothetical protein
MMFISSTLYKFLALVPIISAAPASPALSARAGDPIGKEIPPSCNVTHPIPSLSSAKGYLPSDSALDSLLYPSYYPSPSTDKAQMSKFCLEQCYGYGNSVECKSAYWAENVEVPEDYHDDIPDGTYLTACLFFKRPLSPEDFDEAPTGKCTTPFAANIKC